MNDIELFWARVNSRIKQLNTTQNQVSLDCGMNSRRLQNLSAGGRIPDAFEIVKIASALNTTSEYLVTGIEPSNDNSEAIELIRKALLILER